MIGDADFNKQATQMTKILTIWSLVRKPIQI